MSTSIESRCASYLDAWSRKDLDGVAAYIHPEVRFKAPMQELHGREAYLEATRRAFTILERVEVRGTFVTGERAVLIYDFICRPPIGGSRTAEMVRFQDGLLFLKPHDEQLVRLGRLAERYFPDDPNTCLLKLRQFSELLAQLTATRVGSYISTDEKQFELLQRLEREKILTREVAQLFLRCVRRETTPITRCMGIIGRH